MTVTSAVSAARTILTRLHEVMASRSHAQAKLNTVVDVIGASLDSEVCSIYLLREGMLELFATKGLAQEADVLLLDEPTAGLDPEAAHELMTYIHDLSREQGRTFFITSHRLEEIRQVGDRVTVLKDGRTVATDLPAPVPLRRTG